MVKEKNRSSLKETLENGLGYLSSIISERVFPRREEGTETFMKNIDDIILLIEKRILGKISNFIIIGVGTVFLIFALLSYLQEYLGWINVLAYFSIGMVIFVIGLMMKVKEYDGLKNGK